MRNELGARSFWVLIAAGVFLRFLWLSDTSLLGDEAMLLRSALESNLAGKIPDHGLLGTRGAVYGPMAIWIYQVFLSITHVLIALTALKTVFDTVLLASGVWLIRRSGVRYAREWWILPFLSPHFWFYSRQLWDNNFLVGFSVLAVGAALCFLSERRFVFLFLVSVALAASLNTHLMAVALVAGIGFTFGVHEGGLLLRHPLRTIASLLPFLILVPYLAFALGRGSEGAGWNLPIHSFDGSLLGARLLAAAGFGEYFLDFGGSLSWSSAPLAVLTEVLSLGLIPLSWWGWRKWHQAPSSPARTLVLSVMAAQVALSVYKNVHGHPHYFNAVWPVFWLLAAEGWEAARRARPGLARVSGVFPVLLLLALAQFQWLIHRNHGMRSDHYGPSIAELMRVHRESARPIRDSDFAHLGWELSHREVFGLLDLLEPRARSTSGMAPVSQGRRIELREIAPDAAVKWR